MRASCHPFPSEFGRPLYLLAVLSMGRFRGLSIVYVGLLCSGDTSPSLESMLRCWTPLPYSPPLRSLKTVWFVRICWPNQRGIANGHFAANELFTSPPYPRIASADLGRGHSVVQLKLFEDFREQESYIIPGCRVVMGRDCSVQIGVRSWPDHGRFTIQPGI